MPRYIDADDFRKTMIKRFGCVPCLTDYSEASRNDIPIDDALDLVTTADVVPKREVKELIRENESLAKTVNEASELIHKLKSKIVPRADLDTLKSLITHKEEEAYNKGYADAKADLLEKLQADIARDEILAEYGDEFFEGRIAGFKAVINYILSEDEE